MKYKKRTTLKTKREHCGYTQTQVANIVGITTRHYQRLESGDRIGTPEIWDALEDLFGVPQRVLRSTGEPLQGPHFNKPR